MVNVVAATPVRSALQALLLLVCDDSHGQLMPPSTPVLPSTDHELEDHSGQDYSFQDLHRVDFEDACLNGALFTNSNLSMADLHDVQADGAVFDGAELTGADLSNFEAVDTSFVGAVFDGVRFDDTTILGSDFRNARFDGADIDEFDGRGSSFRGADLSGALQLDSMAGTFYDRATRFPQGFDPVFHGMIFVPEPGHKTHTIWMCLVVAILARTASRRQAAAISISAVGKPQGLRNVVCKTTDD